MYQLMHTFVDGIDLLRTSKRHNVHVSLTQKPLALRAEGVLSAVEGVGEYITEVKMVRSQ